MGNSVGIIMGQMLGAGNSEAQIRDTNDKLMFVSIGAGLLFGGIMAAFSGAFPRIYNTTEAVMHLASVLICIQAIMMPFNSYTNAAYFTLRSGGKTLLTFLFDSGYVWCVNILLALALVRLTSLPILPIYAICQFVDVIKCVIGFVLVKKGVWIRDITGKTPSPAAEKGEMA